MELDFGKVHPSIGLVIIKLISTSLLGIGIFFLIKRDLFLKIDTLKLILITTPLMCCLCFVNSLFIASSNYSSIVNMNETDFKLTLGRASLMTDLIILVDIFIFYLMKYNFIYVFVCTEFIFATIMSIIGIFNSKSATKLPKSSIKQDDSQSQT